MKLNKSILTQHTKNLKLLITKLSRKKKKKIIRTWFLFWIHSIRFFSRLFRFRHHRRSRRRSCHVTFLKILVSSFFACFLFVFLYDVFVLVSSSKNFSKAHYENVYDWAMIRMFWVHELSIFIIYVNIFHCTKIIIICELLISNLTIFFFINLDFFDFSLTSFVLIDFVLIFENFWIDFSLFFFLKWSDESFRW
jgi:hypothetical protein